MIKPWRLIYAYQHWNLPEFRNILLTRLHLGIVYSVVAPFILFWSTLALFLFYIAYRYNILFVSETAVDTQGLIYPRALKQLFVGIYLGEVAMVGMFAVVKSPGPAVLMAAFLVFTILFHITLMRSLDPLLYGLPRSLEAEETIILQSGATHDDGVVDEKGVTNDTNGINGANATGSTNGASSALGKDGKDGKDGKAVVPDGNDYGVEKKGNMFTRFLKPWIFSDYQTLRHMVPQEQDINFAQFQETGAESERDAYFPPSVNSQPPQLWIPEDPLGVSKHEIAETSKVIPISDKGARLDEKNKVVWSEDLDDVEKLPPIYQEREYY